MNSEPISALKNIGTTVASRLHALGVTSKAELEALGSAKAYQWLSETYPGTRLPVCYYLYSLEGAIQDRHWNDFSEQEKTALRLAAGLPE